MIGLIKLFIILVVAISICSGRDYFKPLEMYKDRLIIIFEAQFPVSRGFDVALHCQSFANLTELEGCSTPIRRMGDFGSPDKYLFVSDCEMAQMAYTITTSGKIANLTAIDETSDTANILLMVWSKFWEIQKINYNFTTAERVRLNFLLKAVTPQTFETLLDPAVVKVTQILNMYFYFNWVGSRTWDALIYTLDFTLLPPKVYTIPPTTSSFTPYGVNGTVDDKMIIAIPNGMHNAKHKGVITVIGLVIGAMAASNFNN